MTILHIIFPVNLYKKNPYLKGKDIAVVEEKINFTYLDYHKAKLILHRASMKKYYNSLKSTKKKYFEFNYNEKDIVKEYNEIEFIYPNDHLIVEKWKKICKGKKITILPSINFLISQEDIKNYKFPYYHDKYFYPYIRQKLNVLMTKDNKPVGGKYSFDKDNRNTLPKNALLPTEPKLNNNKYVKEAIEYVEKHFPNNYGSTKHFIYPIDSTQAKKWLIRFVEERLKLFGKYEDALSKESTFVYHSCLSSSLNIGIITDKEVLDYVLKHSKNIPLNSLEGYIRQLIGWRNYILVFYEKDGEKVRKMNFFKHHLRLSNRWWLGKTQIPIIDRVIKKIEEYSYAHHIERLMILGNFMLICEIEPIEVNNWFQSFVAIDSADVFMIPNVLGMSQHSCGPLMMTKPYFSSSNYIKKMSNEKITGTVVLKSGEYDWSVIWDSLYYNFIYKNHDYLRKNYSTSRQVVHWDKKPHAQKNKILLLAKEYQKFIATDV
jgi:deoxyribodipyrimidine photolyase-related protein